MNFLYFPVALVLVIFCIKETENSHIEFRSNPSAILPILTTTFQLRCSVKRYPYLLVKDASNAGASSNPFLKYTNDYSPTSTVHYQHTSGVHYQYTYTSHTTWPTPPALNIISGDVAHVTSIYIVKWMEDGVREDVASVSLFDAASSSGPLSHEAKVEGSCERSPVAGEQGYLTVTWNRPLQDQSGNYVCKISGLESDRHPVTLQSSLQVTFSQPTLTDLISYISDNAVKISHLETKLNNLNNSPNTTSPANLKAQNIQTGSGECMYDNSEQYIPFAHYYQSIPIIFLSMTNFTSRGYSSYDRAEGSVSTSSVSNWGFYVRCHINEASLAFEWLAIDN